MDTVPVASRIILSVAALILLGVGIWVILTWWPLWIMVLTGVGILAAAVIVFIVAWSEPKA